MYITITVYAARIAVNIGSSERTLWFDDWAMILGTNIIRHNDIVRVIALGY